jgi:hypothetical protein
VQHRLEIRTYNTNLSGGSRFRDSCWASKKSCPGSRGLLKRHRRTSRSMNTWVGGLAGVHFHSDSLISIFLDLLLASMLFSGECFCPSFLSSIWHRNKAWCLSSTFDMARAALKSLAARPRVPRPNSPERRLETLA